MPHTTTTDTAPATPARLCEECGQPETAEARANRAGPCRRLNAAELATFAAVVADIEAKGFASLDDHNLAHLNRLELAGKVALDRGYWCAGLVG